ncbi:MAG TPA: hypothetical protein VJV04_15815 [Nitrospiraceae bacterium]|nr:hypothetical protein [Nitrospiraceae bacterium]
MTDQHAAVEMIERQIQELDAVLQEASKDINTVRGSERVAAWKKRTVPLLAQHVGQKQAQLFAMTKPGPSFTRDLDEELSDEVELYRDFLRTLIKQLKMANPG